MVSRQLEFRGISVPYLSMYFEELGARKLTETFPIDFEGSSWKAQIISEKTIQFTANFKVNAVQILFAAENDDLLEQLLKNYRYKTIRVGG
jgi:predicted ATP-grasp superfamily ATP-dependent carboligase